MESDWDQRPDESAIDWLARVLDASGVRVTFDSQRTITGPCFVCGTPANPYHELRPVVVDGRKTSRPFCEAHRTSESGSARQR